MCPREMLAKTSNSHLTSFDRIGMTRSSFLVKTKLTYLTLILWIFWICRSPVFARNIDQTKPRINCQQFTAERDRPRKFEACGVLGSSALPVVNMRINKKSFLELFGIGLRIQNSDFTEVDFSNSRLSELTLGRVQITNGLFNNAHLTGFTLIHSLLKKCQFIKANLSGSKCRQSNFIGSDFRNAILDRSVFEFCNFENAQFQGASLRDVVFVSANLNGAKYDRQTILPFSKELAQSKGMIFSEDLH